MTKTIHKRKKVYEQETEEVRSNLNKNSKEIQLQLQDWQMFFKMKILSIIQGQTCIYNSMTS